MATTKAVLQVPKPRPEVKGPIRCHKCQTQCVDANHYLTHACPPRSDRA